MRREKREEKKRREQLQVVVEEKEVDGKESSGGKEVDKHEMDISMEELNALQAKDSTLGEVRSAAKCESKKGVGFFYKGDLLFRR